MTDQAVDQTSEIPKLDEAVIFGSLMPSPERPTSLEERIRDWFARPDLEELASGVLWAKRCVCRYPGGPWTFEVQHVQREIDGLQRRCEELIADQLEGWTIERITPWTQEAWGNGLLILGLPDLSGPEYERAAQTLRSAFDRPLGERQ